MSDIPSAGYALIGGSGTWGARFPEDLEMPNVELTEYFESFETPYGGTAPFKLLRIGGQNVLRTAMHGMWDHGGGQGSRPRTPWLAAKQVGWVLEQAGVQWAMVEASVGGIQRPDKPGEPLPPWSITINSDYMMFFRPDDDQPFFGGRKRSARFKDPFCPIMSEHLYQAAKDEPKFAGVYKDSVYVCTAWGRFETAKEIQVYAEMGAHVVGHTLAHELPVFRKAGVRLASVGIISNHAEGRDEWVGDNPDAMADFYFSCPHYLGPVMANAMQALIESGVTPPDDPDIYLYGLGQFPVEGA
ncbi:MAG: hypothetical protein OXI80_10455 [Caldilineaceae bacterium]|nr:hypothetical protein [Caldilineaceae bacterium]MDE0338081.1 hypothetical protein [Caldilineaceae bacterium]